MIIITNNPIVKIQLTNKDIIQKIFTYIEILKEMQRRETFYTYRDMNFCLIPFMEV